MTEQELAARVVAWLQEQGWTVHEEVAGCGSCIPDIVAVMDRRLWIIECKRTMGLAVMAQADHWRGRAHWVSVATPARSKPNWGQRRFEIAVLADRGIGRLSVREKRYVEPVRVELEAKMLRRPEPGAVARIRRALVPENKAGSEVNARAGTANGGQWTRWKGTCRELQRAVLKRPGVTLKELLDDADGYHYASVASGRSALSAQLREGAIPGIRIEQDGRHLRLYPDRGGLQSDP